MRPNRGEMTAALWTLYEEVTIQRNRDVQLFLSNWMASQNLWSCELFWLGGKQWWSQVTLIQSCSYFHEAWETWLYTALEEIKHYKMVNINLKILSHELSLSSFKRAFWGSFLLSFFPFSVPVAVKSLVIFWLARCFMKGTSLNTARL